MTSVLNAPYLQGEDAVCKKLESILWAKGALCGHCVSTARMDKMGCAATRSCSTPKRDMKGAYRQVQKMSPSCDITAFYIVLSNWAKLAQKDPVLPGSAVLGIAYRQPNHRGSRLGAA